MRLSPRIYLPLLALLVVAFGGERDALAERPGAGALGGRRRARPASTRRARRAAARGCCPSARRATFRFDPTVAPADRQAFLAAGRGTPEARRLIGLVDGLVVVRHRLDRAFRAPSASPRTAIRATA
jgi:hypothetical protein